MDCLAEDVNILVHPDPSANTEHLDRDDQRTRILERAKSVYLNRSYEITEGDA